jgi:sigma-E factor negative regulatory protein RseA
MNQADMNQDVRENLSAGVDGELSAEQLRFLLRRVDHEQPLQEAWSRYHLARDSLRRELPALASAGFSDRVMLALGQEAAQVGSTRRQHWLRWSAGGAIAASVAAVALMAARPGADSHRPDTLVSNAATTQSQPVVSASNTSRLASVPRQPATSQAVVPPWLSGSSAGLLSQQASATVGASFDMNQPAASAARTSSGYAPLYRYRTLDNNDGSYLLLIDPQQSSRANRPAGQISVGAQ